MTGRTHHDEGSTHIIRYALELGLLWIDGVGRDKVREALDALDALEAKLASIGAGGVQALSAAPAEQQAVSSAVLKAIREANMQLVRTGDDAFMLVPYKVATTEAATTKAGATTGVALGDVYAELLEPDATTYGLGAVWNRHSMRDFADRTHALRMQAAPKAAPQQEAQEPYAFRCLHEWDGLARTSLPPKYACKHCHNFFDAPPSPAPQPAPAPLSEQDEREAVARAIWELMREHEDRCDMELDDLMEDHPIWSYADAACAALAAQGGKT